MVLFKKYVVLTFESVVACVASVSVRLTRDKSRSSVFLCSETTRKRLLLRLSLWIKFCVVTIQITPFQQYFYMVL